MNRKLLPALFISLAFCLPALADVRLPAVLGSHMVLQQKSLVNFWGWCEPGEKVKITTSWDTATYTATGNSGAQWKLKLPTPAAGGPFRITVTGNNKIELEDVLVGEVWLCSGQSNMEMSVNWGLPYNTEVAAATNNQVRFFRIPRTTSIYPQDDVKAGWVVCTPAEMKAFSAAGYFFGLDLQAALHSPVGLISASWGGTPAEVWTPADTIANDPVLASAATRINTSDGWPNRPGATFNAMIYPLLNYTLAGAIWYQGESNVGTASTYRQLLSTMISSWRSLWQKDLPFYYVQIAPFAGYGNSSSSAFLREAQTQVQNVPNTGMVLTTDLVDNINDIHPKMKKEVGQRLANYALAQTYGQPGIAYKTATYQSMAIEKDRIRISFNGVEKGLVSHGNPLTEFYIAGADQVFLPAQAKIEGKTVIVWSPKVPQPVAVRFAFRNVSQPNLFNADGLPVNLFRTDNWNVDIK
jgi:sialate O-acetylesterase